jgi:hypothetical protein
MCRGFSEEWKRQAVIEQQAAEIKVFQRQRDLRRSRP